MLCDDLQTRTLLKQCKLENNYNLRVTLDSL